MNEAFERSNGRFLTQFNLTVETDLSALREVLIWFENSVGNLLERTVFLNMQIILIEGFMNVVKYAHYNLPSNTPINLLVNLFENLIEIRIWDYGLNFDLDKKFREELETSLNNPIKYKNNRGLLLMNCLSDKLIYVREEETRNCLIMQKYIAKNMNLQNQI